MKNLAGNKDCDKYILEELERADIPYRLLSSEPSNTEVPYRYIGFLNNGKIKLTRAWTYWVAEGRIPVKIANKIYNHPEGKKSVRIAGHCGCLNPDEYGLTKFDTITDKIMVDEETFKKGENTFKHSPRGLKLWLDEYVVDYGQPHEFCATTYHIDDQAGLLLFSIIIQEE